MAQDDPQATRRRILATAGELFAERGFLATTMRGIAERAGVNLASAHYHFGSKRSLYLEVVRGEFGGLETRLAALGATPGAALDLLSREELEQTLRLRIETVLETVLDVSGVHGRIVMHEMTSPTSALPVIVKQFIKPQRDEMSRIVARLAPKLTDDEVELCARSIFGQIFFYATHRPVLLLVMARANYPKGLKREATDHITAFSLAGLDRLSEARRARGAVPPTKKTPRARKRHAV